VLAVPGEPSKQLMVGISANTGKSYWAISTMAQFCRSAQKNVSN